jgi:putative restriction endonuclease
VNLWVGITDFDWFSLHASKDHVEEVNFWRPSSRQGFRALQPGGLFLFKLRSRKFIGGGGFFAKYLPLPLSLAWDAFGEGNGARTLDELRKLIARNRHEPISQSDNPLIGCILLEEPFFFEENDWIPLPADFKPGIQMGKTYDATTGTGLRLWNEV